MDRQDYQIRVTLGQSSWDTWVSEFAREFELPEGIATAILDSFDSGARKVSYVGAEWKLERR